MTSVRAESGAISILAQFSESSFRTPGQKHALRTLEFLLVNVGVTTPADQFSMQDQPLRPE